MAAQSLIAGHLQEKKGYFYVVLNIENEDGNRTPKWFKTGLPVKGNKKRAERMLNDMRREYTGIQEQQRAERIEKCEKKKRRASEIPFADFMEDWLEVARCTIEKITYSGYCCNVKSIIAPYFREREIMLSEITPKDIQDFYTEQLKRVKATTVISYHANIHSALEYAVDIELLIANPADRVKRPKKEKYIGDFYSGEEISELFKIAKGSPIELEVLLGAFYGLRRSEIVGLKWNAIDFTNNTITVKHTVTSCTIDGKKVIEAKDRAKSKASLRTLPLVPAFREKLLEVKKQQEEYKRLCGRSYCKDYLDYICVDPIGERISPNYITAAFPQLLVKNGLRHIRFHDLRHSCASLLLANDVPLKQIQEWLGHSDIGTTANIYSHLDYKSKITSANVMDNLLTLPDTRQNG